jgi:hypothetical protein
MVITERIIFKILSIIISPGSRYAIGASNKEYNGECSIYLFDSGPVSSVKPLKCASEFAHATYRALSGVYRKN